MPPALDMALLVLPIIININPENKTNPSIILASLLIKVFLWLSTILLFLLILNNIYDEMRPIR